VWYEDHVPRAVACAVAMQLAMDAVNAENRRDGLPEVEMGIGVNTGEVVVGNIGSHKRAKYGVVGSPVNLTSRIESYTIGGQILISETTWQELRPVVRVTEQMEVEAKGVDQPITVYDVQGIGGAHNLFLPKREEALVPLHEELPLRYTILDGKHLVGTVFTGSFVKLSARGGEICSNHPVAPWSDIKVQLMSHNGDEVPGDLYAKVLRPLAESQAGFSVHFTSISPEVATLFQGLLGLIMQ
jgi:adenylate cyclase